MSQEAPPRGPLSLARVRRITSFTRNAARVPLMATCLGLAHAGTASAQSRIDWPTYGFDSVRSGHNPHETVIGAANVATLAQAWSFDAAAFEIGIDPNVNTANALVIAQPILAQGVMVNGTATDLLFAGDNNGYFFALDAKAANPAGQVVWYQSLGDRSGIGCMNRPKIVGIKATAAIDRHANGGAGAVYIGSEGLIHAFDLATGVELPHWPVAVPQPDGSADGMIHDGANVFGGSLYVGVSSSFCDHGTYYGRVLRIDTFHALVTGQWFPLSGNATTPTITGGGVWGPGGVSLDMTAAEGGVYVATGNAAVGATQQPYAEYVVNLSADLTTIYGAATPVIPSGDNDYGATPVLFQPPGCPTKLLAVSNKSGLLVLEMVNADGSLTVAQSLQLANDKTSVGHLDGTVAWDPDSRLLLVTDPADGPPGPYLHGIEAFTVSAGCVAPILSLAWQTTPTDGAGPLPNGAPISPPIIANEVAYFGVAALGSAPAQAYAVAMRASGGRVPGQVLWQSGTLPGDAHGAPTLVNGRLFIPLGKPTGGVVAFHVPGS